MSRSAVTRRKFAPMRATISTTNTHPAAPPQWRCLLCYATGSGGAASLQDHFDTDHG